MKNNFRKLTCVILALVLCLSLAGCKSDPNCGLYKAETVEVDDVSFNITDVFSNGASIELKDGAICKLILDGDEYPGTFTTEENGKVTITLKENDSVGTIADGVLSIDLLNSDMVINFRKAE